MEGDGTGKYREEGWMVRMKQKGNERELVVAGLKRRLDFSAQHGV